MSWVDTFFNNYGASTVGSVDSSYQNKVYLGTLKQEASKTMSPTGVEYTIPERTVDKTESVAKAKSLYLTDDALRAKWEKTLRANGLDADPIQARAIWNLSVDGASDWYATSNGQQKITPEQYVTWYASGKTKGPSIPTRQVYMPATEQIDADINKLALNSSLGRELTDADKKESWYKDLVKGISKLYSKGTVTTVKQVTNPETGKVEKVVTQTPGVSKEKIEQVTEEALLAADPESAERKDRIDFTKWLFSQRRSAQ